MYKPIYKIYKAETGSFDGMINELLDKCTVENCTIIRLTFFGNPQDNNKYEDQHALILEKLNLRFGNQQPTVSYVAQLPLVGKLILEVAAVEEFQGIISYKSHNDIHYLELEDEEQKTLVVAGLRGNVNTDIKTQSLQVFENLENILKVENYPISSIVRQWNYIERITDFQGEQQHYQIFNDSRSHFYSKTDWTQGYPAATGIGMQHGGIIVDVVAGIPKKDNYKYAPLDNELQVAAYDYSQEVLLGVEDIIFKEKTTPKFERAKAITNGESGYVYISGTAAIRGEESLIGVDILKQTEVTIENINYLISKENLEKTGININKEYHFDMLRVYLKNAEDIPTVKKYMDDSFSEIPTAYLLADVCREELLVEIEGISRFIVSG